MSEVTSKAVEFASGEFTIRGFLARPAQRNGALPSVMVIQEWWGLNDHIKDIAQRFAREGFVSMAPDLYSRLGYKVTKDPNEAAQMMNALSSQDVLRDLNAATSYLKGQSFVDPQCIGMVGFCMGGTFAITQATHNSDLKAAVPFYGRIPPIESLQYLLCPVLYHYGAKDAWVTRQDVERLKLGLTQYGKPGEVHIYPEADHAFFNDTRPEVYRAQDANLAWGRTLTFLREHLR